MPIADAVDALLSRSVAETKSRGVANTDLEVAGLFESIAFNLLLHPRTALYFLLLARNALLGVTSQELIAITTLTSDVKDLANQSFQVDGKEVLQQARNALLQAQSVPIASSSSTVFNRFDRNVSDFLSKHLAPNIKKPGATSLTRPSTEAQLALPADFQSLKDLHSDLLDRVYALAVGLNNFLRTPLSTILTQTTVSRIRVDIEKMLTELKSENSRDAAFRLISARAALRTIRSAPSPTDPVISSTLPAGASLRMASNPASAVVIGLGASGFTLPPAASLNISTPTATRSAFFPQTFGTDLQNQGHLASLQVSYPVSIPVGSFLFLTFTKADGSTISYKVPLSGSVALADVVAAINSVVGTDGTAAEYIVAGSSRIIIWANTPNVSLSVDPCYVDPNFFGTGLVGVNTNSAHALLGFSSGQQSSVLGTTPLSTILDALSIYWGNLVTVGPGLTITGIDTSPGTYLSFTGGVADTLGLTGLFKAVSNSLRIYGSVNGVTVDPVNPSSVLEVGDQVTVSTGVSLVKSFSATKVTLANSLPTFDEVPTVASSVVLAWQALIASLNAFLPSWTNSGFQKDLTKVDRSLAPLNTSAGPAQINNAVSVLSALATSVQALQTAISGVLMFIPNNAGTDEKDVVNGILASLEERKFDRATDLFLRGKLQEALGLDHETASFSGNFLKSSSAVAQNDFLVPNRAQDEGLNSKDLVTRTP